MKNSTEFNARKDNDIVLGGKSKLQEAVVKQGEQNDFPDEKNVLIKGY